MVNTYLLLGRTGDICSVLPFMKQEPERPRLVVSNQHSNLLEGVSYVDVVEWPQGIHLLKEAHDWATSKFGTVKSLQVVGHRDTVRDVTYRPAGVEAARTTSFVKEMWRCAGHLPEWDEVYPLVFDRRNAERESKLVEKYLPRKQGRPKKVMLVFTESHSSPFQYKNLLLDLLKLQFSKSHNIVVDPQAERFFDLLALYEKADMVVSVDSAPLHLGRAMPTIPMVVLAQDSPGLWNGSPWQPNHYWYCRYSDFPNRAVEMVKCIEQEHWKFLCKDLVVVGATDTGWSGGSSVVVRIGMTGRDSRDTGDSKQFPYFKDCLRMGLQKAKKKTDSVCVIVDGILWSTELETEIIKHDCAFAYRMEDNNFRPVVDLFSARKSWWKEHLNEIPDYIFGKDHYWRNGLWALFKKHHGKDITGICHRATAKA